MLKENYLKWRVSDANDKEDTINFMVEILNLKVTDQEEADHLNRQMIMVADLISTRFSPLTIPEIKEAFKMYVANQLGVKVFRLLDCIAIGEILTAYINYSKEANAVFIEQRKKAIQLAQETPESEKLRIREAFEKMIYDEIQEFYFSDNAWEFYLPLEASGKIVISDEDKIKMYEEELEIYMADEIDRIRRVNPYQASKIISDLQDDVKKGNKPIYVRKRCRSILVSQFVKNSVKSYPEFKIMLSEQQKQNQ